MELIDDSVLEKRIFTAEGGGGGGEGGRGGEHSAQSDQNLCCLQYILCDIATETSRAIGQRMHSLIRFFAVCKWHKALIQETVHHRHQFQLDCWYFLSVLIRKV